MVGEIRGQQAVKECTSHRKVMGMGFMSSWRLYRHFGGVRRGGKGVEGWNRWEGASDKRWGSGMSWVTGSWGGIGV